MKTLNYYVLIALAVFAVLIVVSPVRAEVLAYWQFNEAVTGTIPYTGDPAPLDSTPSGHPGYARSSGAAAWGHGKDFATDPTDGSVFLSGFSSKGTLMNHSSDYDWMLGDLQAYRLEFDLEPDDYAKDSRCLLGYHQYVSGVPYPGYRLSLTGQAQAGENYGGKIELTLWDSAGVIWQGYSDPTKAYVPDFRVNPGTWYHLAVEIYPNADKQETYMQFYIDGVDAGRAYYKDAVLNGPANFNRRSGDWAQGNITDTIAKFSVGCMEGTFNYNYCLKGSYDNVMLSTVIPEPSTLALLVLGLVGLLAYGWRKRK